MGIKSIIRRWLDISETPEVKVSLEPVTTLTDSEKQSALSLLATLRGETFRPTPVGRTEVSAREVRIIDPTDTTALLGSLKR